MPDLRLYRVALVIAVILAAASLLALKSPQTIALSTQPTGFDGQAAMSSVQTLAQGYPGRVAGSAADRRAAGWVAGQLAADGLTTHVETFNATIAGRPVSLNNVWAVSAGNVRGTIVVLAPRDSPPLSTQGADDDASGTAALLELASVFAGAAHNHPLVFVSSDGDTDGALGAQAFLDRHRDLPIVAVVTLRRVAGRNVRALTVNGWSAQPLLAPPWLWSLARVAGRQGGEMGVPLPPVTSQILRLAVPSGGGSQAPFVAAGLPAIELSAPGPAQPAVADTLDSVSADTLTRTGRAAEVLVSSLDGAPLPLQGSSSTVFFSRYRQLSGGVVVWLLLVLAMPLAVVTVDLLARARRLRLPLRHAALRLALRAAPWLLTLALVYLANLLTLLPGGFGGPVSPDAVVSHTPRYLRVLLILLFLALAYHYAMAIERRLARRYPADTQAVVAVTHLALLVVAILIVPINPFSLALIVPAALLWPLARSGSWVRSRLPVWGGVVTVVVALVYFGERLHLGWGVWWYFFLLLETRAIPVGAMVVAVVFVASAALLGHELHSPRSAPLTARHGRRRSERERATKNGRVTRRRPARTEIGLLGLPPEDQ
jgi:Peptidase family M28